MTALDAFNDRFARCPLVAILRGIRPDEVEEVGDRLVDAGFVLIEVSLDGPEPFDSIRRLAARLAGRASIGAGSVQHAAAVVEAAAAGATLILAPSFRAEVVAAATAAGLVAVPGIATTTEAFAAIEAGAAALKLFPAEASSPLALHAMRRVLPAGARILPVGGITPGNMRPWLDAGAAGFGIGNALYRPGMSPGEVGRRAPSFVAAIR